MTPKQVRSRVNRISESQGDPETAHSLEDKLYEDVLRAVAHDNITIPEARELCHEALRTKTLTFPRYCS